jgi:4-amino-4-deoxy-L-arabinose transferase-like glycosyltransferase
LALFAVAFLLRFAAAQWLAGEPVWDGHYYDFGARRIAAGHGYSDDRIVGDRVEWHPWCHYPVGYSAWLAAFYWLLGAHASSAHVANALTGALAAVVVFLLAREALPAARARLAGALTAIHPGLVLYGALVMGEVLSALSVMTAFWVTIRGARAWEGWRSAGASRLLRSVSPGTFGVTAGAVVLGLGALVRPQALLCTPLLALVVPRGRSWRETLLARGKTAVVACAMCLLPILPWTARNCRVMDGCALVSTNAGWNLAIGAFPRATGRFETLRSSDGCREVTGQVQQDRCWLQYGLEQIRRAPGRWLGLIPAKLSNTFDHESFAVEYLREARPEAWPEPRRVAWRSVLTAIHRVLVVAAPLAFVSLVLPRRRRGPVTEPVTVNVPEPAKPARQRATAVQGALLVLVAVSAYLAASASTPTFWPIVILACVLAWLPLPGQPATPPALLLPVALVATTALTHAIFFGDDRYHIVVTPALCLLAAAGLRPMPRNTRGADTRGVRAAGASSS